MAVTVPQPLASEILREYADLLRVGRLRVNDEEVCWSTSGSTKSQLQAFSTAFIASLKRTSETKRFEDAVLAQMVYWMCKVVSINYALAEVLCTVRARLGTGCCIKTTGSRGETLVDYSLEVLPEQLARVRMTWSGRGNVICCNPKTGKAKAKATLRYLETEFLLPPGPEFTPTYTLDLATMRSPSQRLISKVLRRTTRSSSEISVDEPLSSPGSKGSVETCSFATTSVASDDDCSWGSASTMSWEQDDAYEMDMSEKHDLPKPPPTITPTSRKHSMSECEEALWHKVAL